MRKYNKTSNTIFFVIAVLLMLPGLFYKVDFLWNTQADYLIFYSFIGAFCFAFGLIGWIFKADPLIALLLATCLTGQHGGIVTYSLASQTNQVEVITAKVLYEIQSRRGTFLRGIVFDCCYQAFHIRTNANAQGLSPVENGDICTLQVKKSYIQYMVLSISCRKPEASEPQD